MRKNTSRDSLFSQTHLTPGDEGVHTSGTLLLLQQPGWTRRMYTRMLKQSGYQVCCVNNAWEAIQCLSHASFDLVLLDLDLPNIHPTTLMQEIRMDRGPVPFVLLSQTEIPQEYMKTLDMGTAGFFVQGSPLYRLQQTIHETLHTQTPTSRYKQRLEKLQERFHQSMSRSHAPIRCTMARCAC
ncbi:MAG: response regulator [Deltaproteobacteria bacterium]|nr:MAG: response regulator [Deltaproteobacteria bacterium]